MVAAEALPLRKLASVLGVDASNQGGRAPAPVTYIFPSVNDGVTDEYAALQTALSTFEHVRIPPKTTVCVSRQVLVPADGSLLGYGKSSVIKALGNITLQADGTWPMGSNGESGQARCMVRASARSRIGRLTFDGNNFKSGGVMVWFASDVHIEDVWVNNAVGLPINPSNPDATATSAVNANQANRLFVSRLHVSRALFAVQLWMCNDCIVTNSDHDVGRAGFWTTDCNRVIFHNLVVTNMNDVGLDFEGGTDCYAVGGRAESCNFGELAIFQGISTAAEERLQFIGVSTRRTATYLDYSGAAVACQSDHGSFVLKSCHAGTKESGIFRCHMRIDFGRGWSTHSVPLSTTAATDSNIVVVGCQFVHNTTGPLFRTPTHARGHVHEDNRYIIRTAPTSSAEWKNAGRSRFGRNVFEAEVALSQYLVWFYEDNGSSANAGSKVFENSFINCGQYAAQVYGQYRIWEMRANAFSDRDAVFGGLFVHPNSAPMFIDQRLMIKPADRTTTGTSEVWDFASTTDFGSLLPNSFGFGVNADGYVEVVNAASPFTPHNTYRITLSSLDNGSGGHRVASQDGTGSGSGRSASTGIFLASVSGAAMTFTKPTNATVTLRANILLNSMRH